MKARAKAGGDHSPSAFAKPGRRAIRVLVVVALVAGGCARETSRDSVAVAQQGSAVSGQAIGIAALLRTSGTRTLGPLRLRVSLRDRAGAVIDKTDDSLPYCLPGRDCWWGARFDLAQFDRAHAIATATVDIVGDPARYGRRPDLRAFEISRQRDGRVLGRAPGDEGHVYVVAFEGDRPRWGTWRSVRPEDMRNVAFASSEFAGLSRKYRLHAYFYSGALSVGD